MIKYHYKIGFNNLSFPLIIKVIYYTRRHLCFGKHICIHANSYTIHGGWHPALPSLVNSWSWVTTNQTNCASTSRQTSAYKMLTKTKPEIIHHLVYGRTQKTHRWLEPLTWKLAEWNWRRCFTKKPNIKESVLFKKSVLFTSLVGNIITFLK